MVSSLKYLSNAFLSLGFLSLAIAIIPNSQAAQTLTSVNIDHFKFMPGVLQVHTGQTVSFLNKDGDPHTIAAQDGSFESPALDAGDSWKHTFTKLGTYTYICTLHPFMQGNITVAGEKQ
jgi:plastocyanin